MAKKWKGASGGTAGAASGAKEEKPATLKDLLNPDTVSKLKAQADSMRAEETKRKEEQRAQAEAARKAERQRLDNDFEHLLKSSDADWRKYK